MFIRLLEEAGGPSTELSWLLWIALGFFVIMVLAGWLSSRFGKKPAAPVAHTEKHEAGHH